jgi:CRP-like cAMP-binding protein
MRVVMESNLFLIDRPAFMDAFNSSPPLRRNLMRNINRRFYETSDRLQQYYRLIDKESRFVVELLDILGALNNQVVAEDPHHDEIFIDWLSNDRSAERLGCDPRTIGHAKQRLKAAGLISSIPLSGTIVVKRSNICALQNVLHNLEAFNLQTAIQMEMNQFPSRRGEHSP